MAFKALKTTKGTGTSNNTINMKRKRRDVIKDCRDMCNHRSMDISVMKSNVTVPKYTKLTLPIVKVVLISTDGALTTPGLVSNSKK